MEKENTYSIKQIEKASEKEKIILRWKSGEKLIDLIQEGVINLTRGGWWKLKKLYERYGFTGLLDKRGGSNPKISRETKIWIKELIEDGASFSRKMLIDMVEDKYGCEISIRHLRRIINEEVEGEAGRPKKEILYDKSLGVPVDCAGSWFLMGADSDMEGVKTINEIIVNKQKEYPDNEERPWWRILRSSGDTIMKKNETLLYLPIYGMERPYHLDKYHKRGLGLLTGSGSRYSYNTMDTYLCNLEKLEISKEMSERLARCYMEALCIEIELEDGSYFYIDGHTKHVWSSKNIPKAFFTILKRAEKGLHQYFLNSSKGHPLILLTCPGDSHLTKEMFNLIDCFENAVGKEIVKASIFDREGLSIKLFKEFVRRKKYFISLLRENQYKGIEDFKIAKEFKPFKKKKEMNGIEKVVEWVADATIELKERIGKKKKRRLKVRVALVKKPVNNKEKLIAIITNITDKEEPDIARIAKRYFDRWPNQENIFKDMMEAIKSDSNHGYKKKIVENRVMLRRKEELEKNLRGIGRKIEAATKEVRKVGKQLAVMKEVYQSQKGILKDEKRGLYIKITFTRTSRKKKMLLDELKTKDEKLIKLNEKYPQEISRIETTLKNKEHYLKSLLSQRDTKDRDLKSLNLGEVLLDMKTEKDHIMSNFKILLTNLSRYAQEQYFPKEDKYQKATLETMIKTFYRQDGYVNVRKTKVDVTLHSYDVPRLQRAVEYACMKINNSNLYTPSGQRIHMRVES